MVSDLHTVIPHVKFVDDTTMVEVSAKCTGWRKQTGASQIDVYEDEVLGYRYFEW